jgi:aromatic ring-opening dioxygenase catalytic subunit (LigB family)
MAEIVGALGVPHTPVFPMLASKQGKDGEISRFFARTREELDRARPDLIVIFDTDHLNTFFFDNLPVFAVGVDTRFRGPVDDVPQVPVREIKSRADIAAHLRAALIRADFDVALAQEYVVDHSVVVPLHFLTPDMNVPVIPIFISGHVAPLPSARRCYRFGEVVRDAIKSWREPLRVVVIGTGSFSLEVAGPRVDANSSFGVPDPDWSLRCQELIEKGEIERLIAEATEERMFKAGNVGGELLNWIAMLGVMEGGKPKWMQQQLANGHAYGAWEGLRA